MRSRAIALVLLCGACDTDVSLGAYAADGAAPILDASVDALPSAASLLSFGNFVQAQCDGTLADRVDDFDGWIAGTAGLAEGEVSMHWESSTLLRISGPPIANSYQVASMGLVTNLLPDQPEGFLVSVVSVTGSAPVGMLKDAAMLSVDVTTMTSDAILGQAGVLYLDASGGDGACSIAVGVDLTLGT